MDRLLLQVRNLEVVFRTGNGLVRAVNGLSYDVARGETLGIVGESGSGKTVSCLALLRLIPEPPGRVVGGRALFEGQDLLRMSRRALRRVRGGQIAILPQDPTAALNPVMTVGAQIAEAMSVGLRLSPRQAAMRAVELLERVGVASASARAHLYPHQLSGGMRQRVLLAMAASCGPKLLIADEPISALDATVRAQIMALVQGLQEELRLAVVWVTHDLGEIARLASRVSVLYAGAIVESGTVRRVLKEPAHPYTIALLGAVPRPDLSGERDLDYVEGSPPDMAHLPDGCLFWPRCRYHTDLCMRERPGPLAVEDEHLAACWHLDTVRQRTQARG
ncbi:MAG: ABC transporter ATP-binding protein [Chloroflexi bacterium]|nr:ABC transporter ATP-binding protein [Chloroflexota bacterium]